MKKIVLQVFLFMLVTSCIYNSDDNKNKKNTSTDSEKKYDVYTRFNDVNKKNELKKKLISGDKNAYKELQEIYGLSGNYPEFTYFSMIYSNKYNDAEASNNVHSQFMYSKDSLSQNIANLYLLKSYQNGYDKKIDISEREKIIDSLKKIINFDFILKK